MARATAAVTVLGRVVALSLLLAATPMATAAPVLQCSSIQPQLTPAQPTGGCSDYIVGPNTLWRWQGLPTANANVTVSFASAVSWTPLGGTQPAQPTLSGTDPLMASVTFLAGNWYFYSFNSTLTVTTNTTSDGVNFNVSTTTQASTCSGTVQIIPCVPNCNNLVLNVSTTTGGGGSACLVTDPLVNVNLPDGALQLADKTTVGANALGGALFTSAAPTYSDSLAVPIPNNSVTVGITSLRVKIMYAGISSNISKACTVTVQDTTNTPLPAAMPAPPATPCIYNNGTPRWFQSCVPLSMIASIPSPACKSTFLYPKACVSATAASQSKFCQLQSFPAIPSAPVPVNGICVSKRAKDGATFKVTVLNYNLFGPVGASMTSQGVDIEFTYYKSAASAAGHNCVPATWIF